MRREAQMIVPGLYLGPVQAALNPDTMAEMGYTHVYVFSLILDSWLPIPDTEY